MPDLDKYQQTENGNDKCHTDDDKIEVTFGQIISRSLDKNQDQLIS